MLCRSCGIDIAEKALICYRCGTATTEATFKAPARTTRRWAARTVIVATIVIALLVFLAFFLLHSAPL